MTEHKKRITITIDPDLDGKIRVKQANTIKKTNKSYSYSQCLSDILRERNI